MKILLVTIHRDNHKKNRLHYSLIKRFSQCNGFDMEVIRSFKKTGRVLVSEHNPDILICYTSYGLPMNFLEGVNCLKVLIETDYYKRVQGKKFNIYTKNGFDIIFRRGLSFWGDKSGIPTVLWPFSADEEVFFPSDSFEGRDRKIGFVGSSSAPIYYQRREAMKKLDNANLLKYGGTVIPEYPEFLRSVVGYLTSAELRTPHGKVFEVMASGTALLTPPFKYQNLLFGDKEIFFKYNHDCSNIVSVAKRLILDTKRSKEYIKNARKVFLEKHTHTCRVNELTINVRNLIEGKELTHFWEI